MDRGTYRGAEPHLQRAIQIEVAAHRADSPFLQVLVTTRKIRAGHREHTPYPARPAGPGDAGVPGIGVGLPKQADGPVIGYKRELSSSLAEMPSIDPSRTARPLRNSLQIPEFERIAISSLAAGRPQKFETRPRRGAN